MLNYETECNKRVAFIKDLLQKTGAKGIVFGNSGGKDSALVGILCRMATENVLGVIMPCFSKRNLGEDKNHASLLASSFDIETEVVDLTSTREQLLNSIGKQLNSVALNNIAPRLRMTTLYTIGAFRGYLVAGTGNRSEIYMGYFTKFGDGACDFNPISDLTASQVFEMLAYLKAPKEIISKAPSAGLFDGQTDEQEMGVTYKEIDSYLNGGEISPQAQKIIDGFHTRSEHKRNLPITYKK